MIDKETLELEYSQRRTPILSIAKKYDLTKKHILRLLRIYKIAIDKSIRKGQYDEILTESFLVEHYTIKQKSLQDISEETGISSQCLSKYLKKYNILIRSHSRIGRPNKSLKSNRQDLLEKRFGHLKIESQVIGGWSCLCDCGNHKIYKTRRLTHDKVKTCGCKLGGKNINSSNWQGYKNIPKSTYSAFENGAIARKINFDISIEEMNELIESQNFKCALSGVKIHINSNRDRTASLDRIDSSKGYTKDNCQWVHKVINDLKWDYSQDEFVRWCKLVAQAS